MSVQASLRLVVGLMVGLCLAATAQAAVQPHGLFSDNAVLQQKSKVPVWGTTDSTDKVTVSCAGQEASSAAAGRQVESRTGSAARRRATRAYDCPGRRTRLNSRISWLARSGLCGGQSNMQWPLNQTDGGSEAIAASANDQLRLITIQRQRADAPQVRRGR